MRNITTCRLCGSDAHFMGALGSTRHYRCSGCGMDVSRTPKPKRAPKPLTERKRSVRQTIWGNLRAYLGHTYVWEFGCDSMSAAEWVRDGHWIVGGNGMQDSLRTITGVAQCADKPLPAGYVFKNPHPTTPATMNHGVS